jgi:hypothetical protein
MMLSNRAVAHDASLHLAEAKVLEHHAILDQIDAVLAAAQDGALLLNQIC